jgi:hypothetical protein
MRVITVARKPLSESSVAANVLEHGCGALNIDATRIRFTSGADAERHAQEWDRDYSPDSNSSPIHTWDNAIGNHPGSKREQGGGPRETGGRWPANLVLQHLPGCRRAGTKRVKSHVRPNHIEGAIYEKGGGTIYGVRGASDHPSHGDLDGETVDAWDCEPGCPVRDMNQQSGVTTNTSHHSYKRGGGDFIDGITSQPERDRWHTETGAASRFFKQVGGDEPCE